MLRKFAKFTSLCAAAALVTGCTIASFETTPVTVETEKGPVVCQLYQMDRVDWDRSIDHPNSISVPEADAICRAEGHRIIQVKNTKG